MQEARLARSEAEQATALAKAEAERCRELAGKLKEAVRTKEEDRSDDGCGTVAQRWVPRTCPLYAASLCPVPILGDYQGAGAVQGREAAGIQGGGGAPQGERAGLWGRGSIPETALLCPRDCPPAAVLSAILGPSQCLSIPCPSLPLRRIEELTQELAASNRLVETLSAEKRDLQQRLEEPLAVGGQVGGQLQGGTSARHPGEERSRPGLGWQLSSLSPSGAVARAVPRPAQAFAQLCRGARGGRDRGCQGSLRSPSAPVCHLNPGS